MNKTFLILLTCLLFCVEPNLRAEEQPKYGKPSKHIISLGFGYTQILATQQSPLPYSGYQYRLMYEGESFLSRNYEKIKVKQEWLLNMEGGFLKNPIGNLENPNFLVNIGWGVFYDFEVVENLFLSPGGLLKLTGGGIFMPHYTNNIAVVRGQIDFAATFRLNYKFNAGKLPMQVFYKLTLPLIGRSFAPDYGASYYEILFSENPIQDYAATTYLGSQLENQLGLDLVFNAFNLRIAYMQHSLWTDIKGIKTRWHNHSVNIGFVLNVQKLLKKN